MPGVFCDHRQVVNGRGRGNSGVLEPCVDAAADRAIEKPPGFKCNGDGQRQKARLVEFYDRVEPVRQISRTPARVLTLKPRNAGLDFSQRDDRAKQVVAVRVSSAGNRRGRASAFWYRCRARRAKSRWYREDSPALFAGTFAHDPCRTPLWQVVWFKRGDGKQQIREGGHLIHQLVPLPVGDDARRPPPSSSTATTARSSPGWQQQLESPAR